MKRALVLLIALAGATAPPRARAGEAGRLPLDDGDRVVLIGDSLIEDDQKYGYLETLLTRSNPGATIRFRNLGWSGDTVRGHARAGFGAQPEGFRQLVEHVRALKPTILVVGYGMTESFDGEAGLPAFSSGMNTLLDAIGVADTRLVFLSPVAHLDLGRPLPDPGEHNRSLARYAEAVRKVAEERRGMFVDLFAETARWNEDKVSRDARRRLSEDGIHPTALGYRLLGAAVARELGYVQGRAALDVVIGEDRPASAPSASRSGVSDVQPTADGMRFRIEDAFLPEPPLPGAVPAPFETEGPRRTVRVAGLGDGSYELKICGHRAAAARSADWARGVTLARDPALDQVERLRAAINDKNRLYFYRWRPQNETYLFGFRKHEQGNNAREIPLFDPLVEAKEAEIARLRVPAIRECELIRQREETK